MDGRLQSDETSANEGWLARLHVELALRAGRTRIRSLGHRGPLRIQRAFHPERDGTAHLYLLHPPGGLVGGDRCSIDVRVDSDARALLTTPGATKIYASPSRIAHQDVRLSVACGGALEHVPQETIFFDGARARCSVRVELDRNAHFLGWEIVCLGRPRADERFTRGWVGLSFEVWRGERPLFVDRGVIDPREDVMRSAWGLGDRCALGTMVCTDAQLDGLRALLSRQEASMSVTAISEELVVVRALSDDAGAVRRAFERARHVIRKGWRREEIDPAIWRT